MIHFFRRGGGAHLSEMMILMIWIISAPWWIKWRPQGGLQKCDCSAPNKLHFMLPVELTTFPFHHQSTLEEPRCRPAVWIRLESISRQAF